MGWSGRSPLSAQPQGLRRRAAEPRGRLHRVPRAARVPALPHHLPGPPPLQHLQVRQLPAFSEQELEPSQKKKKKAPGVVWERGRGLGVAPDGQSRSSAPFLCCRTIYKVAYRQVYRQVPQHVASCCPGWSRASSHALSCNTGKEAAVLPQGQCSPSLSPVPCVQVAQVPEGGPSSLAY